MARVTSKDLKAVAKSTGNLIGRELVVCNWNGYWRVMFNGNQLCSGTARDCVDWLYAFRTGYYFEERYGKEKSNG